MQYAPEVTLRPAVLAPAAVVIALAASVCLATLGITGSLPVIAALVIMYIIALGRDELSAVLLLATSLLIDWYGLVELPLHAPFVTTVSALVLLAILLLRARDRALPLPGHLWLWVGMLGWAALAIPRGLVFSESITYYVNVFVTPMLLYILAFWIVRDMARLRHLFSLLTLFGSLIAVHTIIIVLTGQFLFATANLQQYLAAASDFPLNSTSRIGSFLGNPDWNGAFMAMLFFVPCALFVHSSSVRSKVLYLLATGLMLLALLFTYAATSWIALGAGLVVFILLIGGSRYRFTLVALVGTLTVVFVVVLPSQLNLLLQHATTPSEINLRTGVWQTALNVIQAHPLNGLGLGYHTYLQKADPYRVAAQYRPLAHPHNSYLELAAFAGLPVLLLFVACVARALWLALRNYAQTATQYHPLLGGAIAAIVALSVNSLGVNAWTLPPLAALGWLILGAISAPHLRDLSITARSNATVPDLSQRELANPRASSGPWR